MSSDSWPFCGEGTPHPPTPSGSLDWLIPGTCLSHAVLWHHNHLVSFPPYWRTTRMWADTDPRSATECYFASVTLAIVHRREVDSKAGLDAMHLQGEVCNSNNSLWRHTEARTLEASEFKLSACHVQNDKQTAPATALQRQCRQVLNCQRKMSFSAVVKMYYSERQHKKKQEGKLCTGPTFKTLCQINKKGLFLFS